MVDLSRLSERRLQGRQSASGRFFKIELSRVEIEAIRTYIKSQLNRRMQVHLTAMPPNKRAD